MVLADISYLPLSGIQISKKEYRNSSGYYTFETYF